MAPFHGHPVPGARHGDRGGARRGALRLVRGRPPAPARARRVPLPRRRPRVVPARRLPLLRGHAGRAARGPRRDGGLPARSRAHLSPPRTRTASPPTAGCWPAAADPAHVVVSGDSCGGLLGLGALLERAGRGAGAAGLLRLHLGLVRRLGARPRRGPRGAPRSVPHGGVGPQPGPGVRGGAGGARRPRGSRPPTPTWRACPRSTCRRGSTTRSARGPRRWRGRPWTPGWP